MERQPPLQGNFTQKAPFFHPIGFFQFISVINPRSDFHRMTLFVLNINLQELRQKLYVKINYWLDTLKHFVLRQLKMTMVRIGVIKHYDTVWKLSLFGVFQVRIFPHSNWPQIDTLYLSVFSPNAGKYGLKNFRIWTLFTHCEGPKVLFWVWNF